MDFLLGMDVGSTTVKLVALDVLTKKTVFAAYDRHHASSAATAAGMLGSFFSEHPGACCGMAVCGSAGQPAAQACASPYVQEVVAASIAAQRFHAAAQVLIELGGQDAKVVFISPESGVDMRMNGSCAGGTGAFLDQIAGLLGIPVEGFDTLAAEGRNVYPISGRCGVFARTDIQPLLTQGVPRADIALSSLHAVVKQTLGGLARGRTINAPVLFLGGPCTFIPTLPRVFQERLGFADSDIVVPERAEVMVACGAALSLEELFPDSPLLDPAAAVSRLRALAECSLPGTEKPGEVDAGMKTVHLGWPGLAESRSCQPRFFDSDAARARFVGRHAPPLFSSVTHPPGTELPVYVGLDAGSTTGKFAVLDQQGELIDRFYASNMGGEPLDIMRQGLTSLFEKYETRGVTLRVLGSGATGYGEKLVAAAFQTDVNTVETVAHAEAARHYCPEASFVLDIGGQDMKAIILSNGIITGITLNEACSAGCGSFLETYAASLGVRLDDLAELAFRSNSPSRLGSRCTVFMNSAIVTEQKLGKSAPDILAGLCRSIVENVFTKVLRITHFDSLGTHIVVQGGTFKNDAVLRAFEQFVGREPIRPPFPGEMGAIGAALLARRHHLQAGSDSSFVSLRALRRLRARHHTGLECGLCSNRCSRTLVEFGGGRCFLSGNRCERGADIDAVLSMCTPMAGEPAVLRKRTPPGVPSTDLMGVMPDLLTRDWRGQKKSDRGGASRAIRIGLPRVLGMWAWMPFWAALLRELGMDVVMSPNSSDRIFEQGLLRIPSDTACLPAKLVHGHITELINMGVDRILLPEIIAWPRENRSIPGTAVCAMLQAYATVIQSTDDPQCRFGVPLDKPVLHGHNRTLLDRQLRTWITETFDPPPSTIRPAIRRAHLALGAYRAELQRRGQARLDSLGTNEFAVILGGRPYHSDPYTNHHVFRIFAALGIPVLPLEALPGVDRVDLSNVRMECYNSLHARLLAAALLVSRNPQLEMAQLTSFGCGHDAVLSDETSRILREAGNKELLVLKLDEGDVTGPLSIRIRSFVETIQARRKALRTDAPDALAPIPSASSRVLLREPFELKFEKKHRQTRTVLIPNLSESFSRLAASIFSSQGFTLKVLSPADAQAVELGKRYVHNDICFPAQVNIGEALRFLDNHRAEAHQYALALAKNCENCRAGQYAVLARKALDEAGFESVPMLTTGSDSKDMHPGFRMTVSARVSMVWGMFFVDALERMLRALRPYERRTGDTERVYNRYLKSLCEAVPGPRRRALEVFAGAVDAFNAIDVDRRDRRPRVGIVGEILIKYHPTATAGLQRYLESHGMEIVQPDMINFFRRDNLIRRERIGRDFEPNPWLSSVVGSVSEGVYQRAWRRIHPIARDFRFHEEHADCYGLAERASHLFDRSFKVGEGWLTGAEILDMADHGVDSFVILQPFGCIPNHISGRGVLKSIQQEIPHCQIVALDFDPDTPFANVENRLQMLVWNAKRRRLPMSHVSPGA